MKSYLSGTRIDKNNEVEQREVLEALRLEMLKLIASIAKQADGLEKPADLATKIAAYQVFAELVTQLERQKGQFNTLLQQLKHPIHYSDLRHSLKTFIVTAENLSQRLNNNTSQNKDKFANFHRMRSHLQFQKCYVSINEFPLDNQINYFFGMEEIKQKAQELQERILANIESPEAQAAFLFPTMAATFETFNLNRSVKLLMEMVNSYRGKLAQHPASAHRAKGQAIEHFLNTVAKQLTGLEDNRTLLFQGKSNLLNTVYGPRYLRGLNMNDIYPYISSLSYSEVDEKCQLLMERITLLTALLNEVKQMAQAKNDFLKSNTGTPFSDIFNKAIQLGNAKPKSVIEEVEAELAAAHSMQNILATWILQQSKSQYGDANKIKQGLVNLAAVIEVYKLNPDEELSKQIHEQIEQLKFVFSRVAPPTRERKKQERLLNTYANRFYQLQQTLQATAEMEQHLDNYLDQLSQLQTLINQYGNSAYLDKAASRDNIKQYLEEMDNSMAKLRAKYPNNATLDSFNRSLDTARNRFIDLCNERQVAALMQKGQGFFAIKAEKQPELAVQKTGEQIQSLFGKLSPEQLSQVPEPSIPFMHQRACAVFA